MAFVIIPVEGVGTERRSAERQTSKGSRATTETPLIVGGGELNEVEEHGGAGIDPVAKGLILDFMESLGLIGVSIEFLSLKTPPEDTEPPPYVFLPSFNLCSNKIIN